MQKRYLLVSRIGPGSQHSSWMPADGDTRFDMLLSSYDRAVDAVTGDNVKFEYRPGPKISGYAGIFKNYRDVIATYDYIALFDDDLSINHTSIGRMFDISSSNGLKISQPSLTHDSYFSHACLLNHKGFILRYVSFIEMMCPVFRSDVLLQVTPLFELGYESGIDLVWCNLVGRSQRDFAVIDAVQVRHTRPVGVAKALNGFTGGRRYENDIDDILARFDLPWIDCVPYGAIRSDGAYVDNRLALALPAIQLAWAGIAKAPAQDRLRRIKTYWQNLLGKKVENVAITDFAGRCAGERVPNSATGSGEDASQSGPN